MDPDCGHATQHRLEKEQLWVQLDAHSEPQCGSKAQHPFTSHTKGGWRKTPGASWGQGKSPISYQEVGGVARAGEMEGRQLLPFPGWLLQKCDHLTLTPTIGKGQELQTAASGLRGRLVCCMEVCLPWLSPHPCRPSPSHSPNPAAQSVCYSRSFPQIRREVRLG